uniref:Uncharacterized protein n=1 Tax=Amphimedon queenslandica TaxID=400682 RepID=A0A1X7VXL3_AMPQE
MFKKKKLQHIDCYDVDESTEAVEDELVEVQRDEELNENVELEEDEEPNLLIATNEGHTEEDEEPSPLIATDEGHTKEDEEPSLLIATDEGHTEEDEEPSLLIATDEGHTEEDEEPSLLIVTDEGHTEEDEEPSLLIATDEGHTEEDEKPKQDEEPSPLIATNGSHTEEDEEPSPLIATNEGDTEEDEESSPFINDEGFSCNSSATQDTYDHETHEELHGVAQDLSEEVCDLQLENELLKAKNCQLQKENDTLKACLQRSSHYALRIVNVYSETVKDNILLADSVNTYRFSADYIFKNDNMTEFYTGLPSYDVFQTLFSLLSKSE